MSQRQSKRVLNNSHFRRRLQFGNSRLRSFPPTITTTMLAVSASVYIALRLWSIRTPRLWGDELFNYSLSQGSWLTIIKRAGLDMAHPPLFYLLLKPWIYVVGSSMAGLRVFTVALSIAALVPLIVLGRELLFRTQEIALALGLMAVNSYLILYSYYLRPYSLLFCLTLCSHIVFIRFLRGDRSNKGGSLLILLIVNILFVYTHYYALLVIAAQYLWIAFMARRHLRRFTWAVGIITLSFLPWVGVIVYVSTKVSYTFWNKFSWATPPNLQSVVLLLRCFNGGFESTGLTLLGSVVFLLLVLLAFKYSIPDSRLPRQDDDTDLKPLALLTWLTIFPIVVSLCVCYAFTQMWQPRYVIVAIGPYLLLIAACAFRLPHRRARIAAVAFVLGWATIAGFTTDIAEVLHGPNAPSYWLALDLSRTETQTQGPVRIYGLSPYAEQGLRLALSLTGEQRFKTISCRVDAPLTDDYFWIALTEHDPLASKRMRELASDSGYSLGEPIYSGESPQRHILIPVWRK